MSFQKKIDEIIEHWNKYPIPEHIKNNPNSRLMTTIEGLNEQLANMKTGTNIIMVATLDENDPSIVNSQSFMVNKE